MIQLGDVFGECLALVFFFATPFRRLCWTESLRSLYEEMEGGHDLLVNLVES